MFNPIPPLKVCAGLHEDPASSDSEDVAVERLMRP